MRYSVDATGVAAVLSEAAACFDDVLVGAMRTLAAVDTASGSLRADAAGVSRALEAVFVARRQSGPGIAAYASGVAERVQTATLAFIAADDQMASQTEANAAVAW